MKVKNEKESTLTIEDLKKELEYNPDTGEFRWIRRAQGRQMDKPAGCLNKSLGYKVIRLHGVNYYSHRLAWLYMTGEHPPKGMEIDHVSGDRSDCRFSNLRLATRSQNRCNAIGKTNSLLKYKGVCFYKKDRKFTAAFKNKYLGLFVTPEEAARAYDKAALAGAGIFALTNQMLGLLPAKKEAA